MSGELITTWLRGLVFGNRWPDGYITVQRADPELLIADELLCEMASAQSTSGEPMVMVGFRLLGPYPGPVSKPGEAGKWFPVAGHHGDHLCHIALRHRPTLFCFTGSILRVEPKDQPVILYRIGEFNYEKNAWEARWPD